MTGRIIVDNSFNTVGDGAVLGTGDTLIVGQYATVAYIGDSGYSGIWFGSTGARAIIDGSVYGYRGVLTAYDARISVGTTGKIAGLLNGVETSGPTYIDNAGSIQGGSFGIQAGSTSFTLSNSGTVSSAGSAVFGYGLTLIYNSGTI